MNRNTLAATAVGATALLFLTGTEPALASPDAVVPLGTFTCSNGTTIDPLGIAVPGFSHATVGFVGGKAVSPRWFQIQQEGTLTITASPSHHGDVVPFSINAGEKPPGKSTKEPALERLIECESEPMMENYVGVTLDAGLVAFLGLDVSFVGDVADVSYVAQYSVFLLPTQLEHR